MPEEAVIADATSSGKSSDEPETQPLPAEIEEAVTSFEAEPSLQAEKLEAIVAEIAAQTPEKPAKKLPSRKKSSKKAAAEEISAVAETPAPDEDLFDKSEPDWKEVSLPATYESSPEASEDLAEEEHPAAELDVRAEEPSDVSEQDLDDLRALDEERFERDVDFEDDGESAEKRGETASGPLEQSAEAPHYEVRPVPAADAEAEMETAAPAAAAQRSQPQRGWAFLFILITLLAFFVMALWIAFNTGALKIRGAADAPAAETVTIAPVDRAGASSGKASRAACVE